MKTTPLTEKHRALGAKMMDFAGYEMPVVYSSINEEHLQVRKRAGVFDVSHMGEFIIEGENAAQFLQHVTSNDVEKLNVGDAQYTCLPNDRGGIVDDLIIYKIEENQFLAVVNASNIEKDWNWIQSHQMPGMSMTNRSDDFGLLALQGPEASTILQRLTSIDLSAISFYKFKIGEVAGIQDVIISATGYTGSGGFELYVPNDSLATLWDALFEAADEGQLLPAGLGARDTLRMEMGYCLYGNDISDETNPIEAGLGWITKLKTNFVSDEIIQAVKEQGVERKLVGIELIDRGIPRQGYEICNESGETIGVITSGTQSPSLGKAIGMGYVKAEHSKAETPVFIKIRNKLIEAKVVKTPFYKGEE